VSWWWNGEAGAARISATLKTSIQQLVDEADVIVGFNFKFDYHWLKKWGIKLDHKRIYDCQIAEFVIQRQQNRYPSLEDSCITYDLGHKVDVIKLEYWDKGVNTDQIPWEVLKPYAVQDALLTYKLYHAQQPKITPLQQRLLLVMNADLHVLQEMEYNGIRYDADLCATRSGELETRIKELQTELNSFYPEVPILWSSGDQLSAFLYGGTIKETVKDHVGFFKSGPNVGQPRYANREIQHQLPRLYEPLRGSELKKEGFYATNEDTLLKLKGKQGPLKVLLELSKLEKLNGTYYQGLPKLNANMAWPDGMLHGSFNQCTTVTGRLSSDKPNLQNFASELQDVFITRYADSG
jgi:DNA polymerase-1